ncbi:MAG: dTDP-glucose 4,6-dehydratase [Terriglobia bacterium]
MKTILVTGGAGFIGSNFVRYLYDKYPDYRIIVLDLLTYAGNAENSPEGAFGSHRYEFWHGDVRNSDLADTLVSRSDIVVHMAAESHVTRSIFDNRLFFDTDVLGTQSVANAVVKHSNKIERFVHISTSEVYGTARAALMNEEHPLNPMSPYASAKCGADRLVYSYWATYHIPAVIIRPFNNFGPYQHLEKAVPRFITSCILGEPLTIHGDGSAARDWLFVTDHCEALDRVLHIGTDKIIGEAINLGTGEHKTILEVAKAVLDMMQPEEAEDLVEVGGRFGSGRRSARVSEEPPKSHLQFIGDRPGQVIRHTCDPAKAKRLLGWEARTPFEEGLRQTIDWYRANRLWWRPQMWMRHIPIITASGQREVH